MADLMTFPNTVDEFMEKYKITDTEQVYTNGAELVPIFRMKQWFEHLPTSDVVEVVRCKDCKWFDLTDPCGTLSPNAHRCKRVTRLWFEDDAFCAYGERRENDRDER